VKRIVVRALTMGFATVGTVGAQSAMPVRTVAVARVYAAPSVSAPVVGEISRGTVVLKGKCAAGWCTITSNALRGYVGELMLQHPADKEAGVAAVETRRTLPPARDSIKQGSKPVISSSPASPSVKQSSSSVTPRTSSVPNGATARCRDGTYSFSANRRGTCSHHKGVAVWYHQ
jgi:hypothetical protein